MAVCCLVENLSGILIGVATGGSSKMYLKVLGIDTVIGEGRLQRETEEAHRREESRMCIPLVQNKETLNVENKEGILKAMRYEVAYKGRL